MAVAKARKKAAAKAGRKAATKPRKKQGERIIKSLLARRKLELSRLEERVQESNDRVRALTRRMAAAAKR